MTERTKSQLIEEINRLKKQIVNKSLESETRLSTLFNAMKDIVFEMDYDGRYLDIAPTSPDLMFKLPENAAGKTLHEVFPKNEADFFLEFVQKTINNNKPNTIEYPLLINNKTIWFEGTATPKTNNSIFYIARDITQRKQTEERLIAINQQLLASNQQLNANEQQLRASNQQLEGINQQLIASEYAIRESEDRYEKIFDYAPIGIATVDIDGNPISMNHHILKILGSPSIEASKLINVLTFKNLIDCGFSKDFRKCIESGEVVNNEANYTSNWNIKKRVKYILSPLFNENNKITSLQIIFEDVTEQLKAKQALIDSEKTFRAIFDTAVDAIYIQNIDGTFIDVNQGVVQMYGYQKDELIGKTPEIIGAPGMNDNQMVADCIKKAYTGKPQQFEFWGRKKNGEIFPKIVRVSSGYYFGKIVLFAFAVDITQQKNAEAELRSQNEEYIKLNNEHQTTNKYLTKAREKAEESDRLKTAFLQNVSHEIRTPMNGILGFTSLLKTEHNSHAEQQSYVNMIMKSGKRMLSTINDLMDISKLETGQVDVILTVTNINDELNSLYRFFKPEANSKGVELHYTTTLPSNDSKIYTDRKKLTTILTNIIKNAIKYTDKGTVNFGYKLLSSNENAKLEFFVKDTGIGIPKNRHKAIFERFIQADISDVKAYEGTGLGLSISKEYISMLGGEIWVESTEDEGSCFYLTIPYNKIATKNQHKLNDIDSASYSQPKKLKVLIAEDELIADAFLTAALKDLIGNVIHVKNGKEAVEICRNTPDLDLILMDIKMPIMSGYEATRQIRKFNTDIVILAQTAFALAGDRKKSIDAGCNDYITKPIDRDKLLDMIKRLL